MIGPEFKINNVIIEFYLDTKTKQWQIGRNFTQPTLILSKAKGDAVIKFLKAFVKSG